MRLGVACGLVAALAAGGCDDGVVCGPGTVRAGGVCVVSDDPPAGPGASDAGTRRDAGRAGPGGGGGGGGMDDPMWGTGGGGSAPPGCEPAECAEWASAIAAGLRERQAAAGCTLDMAVDARVEGIAIAHAEHQASIDRLTAESPDGDLFTQIRRAGVDWSDVGALFSVTREGADDVLMRWEADADIAPTLRRCDDLVGVGVATSSTGASYVTALVATL